MKTSAQEKAATSYDPKKEAIGQLLSLTNPSIVVPDFQRNYSWKTEHIEVFWNDLMFFLTKEGDKPKGEYFLGSVVIVRTDDGLLKLLDGQQRMATSAILLSVIRDKVKAYNASASEQLQTQYLVGYDFVEDKKIHKLRLNKYDRDFFRKLILQARDGEYTEPNPEMASHRLILNARRYFEDVLDGLLEGLEGKSAFEKAMLVSKCLLNHMTVISVYSVDEESAAEVFETLNDRGIGLSTPDLLRNLVIRRAKVGQAEEVVEQWKSVVSFETDTAIKNFLRHYWVSRYGDIKTQSLYREIKNVIEREGMDSLELSTDLCEASARYQQLRDASTDNGALNKTLGEVRSFGASANLLFPVLLGLVETLDNGEAAIGAKLLLNVFVRHAVISGRENSKLENTIYSAVRNLRTHKNIEDFCAELQAGSPTDDEVKQAFLRLSVSNNARRRHLLIRIEASERETEELDVAGSSRVHVEHIYPQNPPAEKRWDNHKQVVDRMGNLTLLSAKLNMAIKNGDLDAKKGAFSASEIHMTRKLAEEAEWTPERVDERQAWMAEKVPSLWPVELAKLKGN